MNNINTNQITDPNVQQPFLGPSLAFLQDATKEAISTTVRSMIGAMYDPAKVYILWGCVLTGVSTGSGAYSVTAGGVFFNGEVYAVDAVSGTLSSQTLYSAIAITNPSPDPVEFSDGSSKNVHDVRKWAISAGSSGSNAFSTWIPIGIWTNYTPTVSVDGGGSATGTATGWYLIKNDMLIVTIDCGSMTIGASTSTVTFSLPSIVGNPGNKQSWGTAYSYDGTNDVVKSTVFPSSSGTGVIGVTQSSGNWTTGSGQSVRFEKVIRLI